MPVQLSMTALKSEEMTPVPAAAVKNTKNAAELICNYEY